MPPLSEVERAALKEDIEARGIQVPIIIDQHGTILDGHHRVEIAEELSINVDDLDFVVQNVKTVSAGREFALALNLKRRHLSQEHMRELIKIELKRTPEATNREIGRRLGVSHHTVAAVKNPKPAELTAPAEAGNLPTHEEEIEEVAGAIQRNLSRAESQTLDNVPRADDEGTVLDTEEVSEEEYSKRQLTSLTRNAKRYREKLGVQREDIETTAGELAAVLNALAEEFPEQREFVEQVASDAREILGQPICVLPLMPIEQ